MGNMRINTHSFAISMISEIFAEEESLTSCLEEARDQGAELAVLPELPLNDWAPAKRIVDPEDAEQCGGIRETILRHAAKQANIAVLGGVIRELPDGRRYNLALLINPIGEIIGAPAKHVLPNEQGFWECYHYEPTMDPPNIIEYDGIKFGVQICSDVNRPTSAQILAAQGVQVILAPRATDPATWERWLLAYRAMALTASAWVISVNRPYPELGVPLGGPSLVVNPMGEVVLETTDTIVTTNIDLRAVEAARQEYPGYLAWPAQTYLQGWQEVLDQQQQDG